jgi:hypothetical protein
VTKAAGAQPCYFFTFRAISFVLLTNAARSLNCSARNRYLSPNRAIGSKSNYKDEKRDSQILQKLGSTVYLTPENRKMPGKKYDAIVNGQKFEFKNVRGGVETLKTQFLRSRSQASNVFINLEKSPLAKHQVIAALYGARNSPEYGEYNRFGGGKIILKIRGQTSLTCLNVDDLKVSGK